MRKNKGFSLLAFGAMAVTGIGASMINSVHNPKIAKAETVEISNLDDFKRIFNKGAAYCSADINLTADIDVSSYMDSVRTGQSGMAGEYSGTFNGNGHVIYGIGTETNTWGANVGALFNIVGPNATIKNLVIDWTACRDNIGSIGYQNQGTLENVTVITRVPGNPNSFGAFFAQNSGGTYKNCNSHFIITGGMGGSVGAVSFGGAPSADKVINCSFTRYTSGSGNTAAANNLQNFTQVQLSSVYSGAEKALTVGETLDLTSYTMGIPGTWTSNSESVTVDSGFVTGVSSGEATVTATMDERYSSYYPNTSAEFKIVVGSATDVTGVSIKEESLSIGETKQGALNASLTGTNYESITWYSEDEETVSVEGNGLSAVVTGVKAGNTNVGIRVVSSDGNTYSASVNVEVLSYTVVTSQLPKGTNFNPQWDGAGLLGVIIDVSQVDGLKDAIAGNTYKNSFEFSAVVTKKSSTSTANFSLTGWQFDTLVGNTARLYVWFTGAPGANTGLYSLTFNLSHENNAGKQIYNMSLLFDGTTLVVPSGSISGDDSLQLGTSATYTASFTYVNSTEYEWSVDNASVLSMESSTSNSVVVNALAEGNAVLTCKVVEDGQEYSATFNVEVISNAKDVVEIAVSSDEVSVKEGKTQDVEVTFVDGILFESIEWKSNDESVATVEFNGKSATITGVSAGNAIVTVTVVTSSSSLSKHVKVNVLGADKMTMYLSVPDDFVNLGNTGYGIVFYGRVNDSFKMNDTGVNMNLDGKVASIYEVVINIDTLTITNPADILWMQISSGTNFGARWGAGINVNDCLNNKKGALITCNNWELGSTALKIVAGEDDVKAALEFYDIRDEGDGICYLLNDQVKLSEILDNYANLSSGTKAILDNIYELADDSSFTFSDTINYLSANANVEINSNNNELNGTLFTNISNNIPLVAVIVALGISAAVAYYFLNKKKFVK